MNPHTGTFPAPGATVATGPGAHLSAHAGVGP